MTVVATGRLNLRRLTLDDAPFILELVNDPAWLRFIGDKNVHSFAEARDYIARGPLDMYERHGFGLYCVELKDGTPIGMCGILRRAGLDDPDLGFALLPAYRRAGYTREAAAATLDHARGALGLKRILAITSLDNDASAALLRKVGFTLERTLRLPGAADEVLLFAAGAP